MTGLALSYSALNIIIILSLSKEMPICQWTSVILSENVT